MSNISKSQYAGTLKDSICLKCNTNLNHMNREEQDDHEKVCSKQKSISEYL